MYRSSGSVSVLSGVLSGPYTGKARTLDALLIEDATRERLHKALSGRGAPEPIAYERPGFGGWFNPGWGLLASVVLITLLFAFDFGSLGSSFAEQPPYFAAFYLVFAAIFAVCLVAVLRERATYGGGALRPGRYLFPLDAVEISLPDKNRRQTVTVRPLGDARDAIIEQRGRQTDLVIRFEGGDFVRWPLRADPHGDLALRRLERAQRLLEELSYTPVLDHAFTNDLFFEIRVDKSWDKLAPGAAPTAVRATTLGSLAIGRFAPVLVAAITLAFGGGAYAVRSSAGDVAIFNQAYSAGTEEAMDRYLAIGGKRVELANERIQELRNDEKIRVAQKDVDAARERAWQNQFTGPDPIRDAINDSKCADALRAMASPKHPKTAALLADNLHGTPAPENRVVFLDFQRHGDTAATIATLYDDETAFTHAFQRVLSDSCPTSTLRFIDGPRSVGYGAHLVIDYTIKQHATTWEVGASGSAAKVHPEDFLFEVHLLDRDDKDVDAFTLTLPAAVQAPVQPRDRSIISIPSAVLPAELVNEVQTARAFDRLYDEVWSLFFDGDPHVPLKAAAAPLTP